MRWFLRVLHWFGLTNLSDEDAKRLSEPPWADEADYYRRGENDGR